MAHVNDGNVGQIGLRNEKDLGNTDCVEKKHSDLSNVVTGDSASLVNQISELQENLSSQSDVINDLKNENDLLRKELDTVKKVLIHTNYRVDHTEREITIGKSRSMNNNILIHAFQEQENEDLNKSITDLFTKKLKVPNVQFNAIHRIGNHVQSRSTASGSPKPRIIVASLKNPGDKTKLFQAANRAENLQVRITNQYPEEVRDTRSRLFQVQEQYKAKDVSCQIKGDKLVFSNGSVYSEKVKIPSAEQVLHAYEPDMCSKLDHVDMVHGETFREKGNTILSSACSVKSYNDCRLFALKALSSESAIPATSHVLVYRFTDSQGQLHEGYDNDREYGAGQCIMRELQEKGINDIALVMSRKVGEHLGFRRYNVFKENAMSAVVKI